MPIEYSDFVHDTSPTILSVFGVKEQPTDPDNDDSWCNEQQHGGIFVWEFGISGSSGVRDAHRHFVWITCHPPGHHGRWAAMENVTEDHVFHLDGTPHSYMHLPVLEAVEEAWKSQAFHQLLPGVPFQAAFAVEGDVTSIVPEEVWTAHLVQALGEKNYQRQTMACGLTVQLLKPRCASNQSPFTVVLAYPPVRRLELGTAEDGLHFALHTHAEWPLSLGATIKVAKKELKAAKTAHAESSMIQKKQEALKELISTLDVYLQQASAAAAAASLVFDQHCQQHSYTLSWKQHKVFLKSQKVHLAKDVSCQKQCIEELRTTANEVSCVATCQMLDWCCRQARVHMTSYQLANKVVSQWFVSKCLPVRLH